MWLFFSYSSPRRRCQRCSCQTCRRCCHSWICSYHLSVISRGMLSCGIHSILPDVLCLLSCTSAHTLSECLLFVFLITCTHMSASSVCHRICFLVFLLKKFVGFTARLPNIVSQFASVVLAVCL